MLQEWSPLLFDGLVKNTPVIFPNMKKDGSGMATNAPIMIRLKCPKTTENTRPGIICQAWAFVV
jgi:hypothetical protein